MTVVPDAHAVSGGRALRSQPPTPGAPRRTRPAARCEPPSLSSVEDQSTYHSVWQGPWKRPTALRGDTHFHVPPVPDTTSEARKEADGDAQSGSPRRARRVS